jgi:E3 SUMO-protein ligase NSE2
MEYLRTGPKKCPATGCNVKLTLSNVIENPTLAKQAKAYLKRQARREAEDEEVEELTDSE